MARWVRQLRVDPLPALLAAEDAGLVLRARRDLLAEDCDPTPLWELAAVTSTLRRQIPDGSWHYPGRATRSATEYDQLATYEALLPLVEKYCIDMRHPAVERAAEFLFDFQTEEGDLRGMYGNQYSPNYTAAILAVLLEAGFSHDDPRIESAMRWLLAMRQDDGGWAIPFRTLGTREASGYDNVMRLRKPVAPDRSKPFSHFVTGVVVRALAAHPIYRSSAEAKRAATLLGTRLFKADLYPDRRAADNWAKFRYPFRWTDVVSALDAMLLVGIGADDPAVSQALEWLVDRQAESGLWRSPYEKAADRQIHHWVSFAIARVFRRAYGDR